MRMRTHRLALGPGAVMTMAAVLPGLGISDLLANKVFMSGFFGFLFAQVGKVRQQGSSQAMGRQPACMPHAT